MGDARESFCFSFPFTDLSGKDRVRQEPSSVLGGEIGSSEVRDGGCTSSSFFARPERHQASGLGSHSSSASALPNIQSLLHFLPPFHSASRRLLRIPNPHPHPSSGLKKRRGGCGGDGLT